MLSRAELKEIASLERKDSYFASLYLNVDPVFNKKGDYIVHLKNSWKPVMAVALLSEIIVVVALRL